MKNFAIIGLGNIANKFASCLVEMEDAQLIAVASRSREKSLLFGEKYGVDQNKCYDDYQRVITDSDVDVVYIALPNNMHYEYTMKCLENYKPVLCEKPSTLNVEEITSIVKLANKNNTFYMEAMKTRFLPALLYVEELIASGEIGELKYLQADFGFATEYDSASRLYNPELGGGSLYDVGIYPISLAQYLLKEYPLAIASENSFAENGVDTSGHIRLNYTHGAIASLFHSINLKTIRDAQVICTNGRIRIPMFSNSQEIYIETDGEVKHIPFPFEINGMEYQIREVIKRIDAGEIESPRMSHKHSVECMEIIEEIMKANEKK